MIRIGARIKRIKGPDGEGGFITGWVARMGDYQASGENRRQALIRLLRIVPGSVLRDRIKIS